MTATTGFTMLVSQNKHIPLQAGTMDAVITVTAAGLGSGSRAAEVLLIDCSGSMDMPHAKIIAARRATRAAIDALRDGVLFAVVAGTERAEVVYPSTRHLAESSRDTRAEAKLVVGDLVANGGTAMGTWLTLADELLGEYPDAVRHAMMFTDGYNQHESPVQLGHVLDQVRGRFTCDVRGIGDQWEPAELRRIVSVLNGQARGVAEFADMTADFTALMQEAMRKVVPDVDMRLRMLGGARLRYLKQVHPTMVDLTGQLIVEDERTMRLPTGAWGDGTREYQIGVEVDSTGKPTDQDTLAVRVELDVRGQPTGPLPPGLVLVNWTDEPLQTTKIDPKVAHYTDQAELGDAVNEGCAAAARQDVQAAERHFGRAVKLAVESGNQPILDLLAAIVDIKDPTAGMVRLKTKIRLTDLKGLAVGSGMTSRTGEAPVQPAPSGPAVQCTSCGWANDTDAILCEKCGHRFGTGRPA